MKIGIYGGSFNPIHRGHVEIIKHVLDKKKLDKLIVIPVGNPSHREGLLSSIQRMEMATAACKEISQVEVSDIEIKEKGTSYTYDTLLKLKKIYKDAQFYEIIGEDSANYLHTWRDYNKMIEETKFIVLKRRGWDYLADHPNIEVLDSPIFPYSSTEVREAIEDGKDVSHMIPKEVEEIIKINKLYHNEEVK